MRKRYALVLIGLLIVLLTYVFYCQTRPTAEERRLTSMYGDELEAAYRAYREAVLLAYETDNISQLYETATVYALEQHLRTLTSENIDDVAEWWKVELVSFTVKEYSSDRAIIVVVEKYIGNIPERSRGHTRPWRFRLEKDNGKWKVSGQESPFSSNDDIIPGLF